MLRNIFLNHKAILSDPVYRVLISTLNFYLYIYTRGSAYLK
jgi:hypothetical protein